MALRLARRQLWVAPAVAVAATGVGFVQAHAWDVPPAQLSVALLCGLVALSWVFRMRRG